MLKKQHISAYLIAVTGMAIIYAVVHGSMNQSAESTHSHLTGETHKAIARQMAEAGIEENIADLGSGLFSISQNMHRQPTYEAKPLGEGQYTTHLTSLGFSENTDTVQIVAYGTYKGETQTIEANLRVNKYQDTVLTPVLILAPVAAGKQSARIGSETLVPMDSIIVWDTILTVDTKSKVQILSWK